MPRHPSSSPLNDGPDDDAQAGVDRARGRPSLRARWLIPLVAGVFVAAGCSSTGIGATVGGAAGAASGHGVVGTVGGAVVGGVIGHEVGKRRSED